MKRILSIGIVTILCVYAQENPLSLDSNLQKIDKEQEAFLSCFKMYDKKKATTLSAKVNKTKIPTPPPPKDIRPPVSDKTSQKLKSEQRTKERNEAMRIKRHAQKIREEKRRALEQKESLDVAYQKAIKEVD